MKNKKFEECVDDQKTDHVVGDLSAGVGAEVELELDGLVLFVRRLRTSRLALISDPKTEVNDGIVGLDQIVAVHELQFESRVLGEELVKQQLSHRRPKTKFVKMN